MCVRMRVHACDTWYRCPCTHDKLCTMHYTWQAVYNGCLTNCVECIHLSCRFTRIICTWVSHDAYESQTMYICHELWCKLLSWLDERNHTRFYTHVNVQISYLNHTVDRTACTTSSAEVRKVCDKRDDIRVYSHIHQRIWIYIYMHTHIYIWYTRIYIYTYIYIYIYMYIYASDWTVSTSYSSSVNINMMYVYMYICAHTCMYVYVYMYMYTYTHTPVHTYTQISQTDCIHLKTHRMPYLYRSFSAKKNPIINGSFAENDWQLKASYRLQPLDSYSWSPSTWYIYMYLFDICMCIPTQAHAHTYTYIWTNIIHCRPTMRIFGVATISRLFEIIGLFCKRAL